MLVGVEDRESGGNSIVGTRQVMIGDDEVEAEALRGLCLRKGAHSGVDGDDESNSISKCRFEDRGLKAVALAQTVWNVKANFATEQFDGGLEQDDRGGAVDVVIAVEQDGFLARDRCFNAFNGSLHAEHEKRIVQMGYFRIEKCKGFGGGVDTAGDEEFSKDDGNMS